MRGPLSVPAIASLVAGKLQPGWCVNLGIGMPLAVASAVPMDREVVFHSENGILGMVPLGPQDVADGDLVDAAKQPVAVRTGGSFVSHADSFALVRGGHLDASVMGALQVAANGDLANWWDGSGVPGVGGAMDLAAGARRVFVMMRHVAADGAPKLVRACSAPLTGLACVDLIFTDFGVFEPQGERVRVIALAEGVDPTLVQELTEPDLEFDETVSVIPVGGVAAAR